MHAIIYQIRVNSHLEGALTDWFAPLTIVNEPSGEATLTGPMRDQAELYSVLLKLYNLNFTLLALQPLSTSTSMPPPE